VSYGRYDDGWPSDKNERKAKEKQDPEVRELASNGDSLEKIHHDQHH
jgi:hypothetical protein